jgi:hypothetical protein
MQSDLDPLTRVVREDAARRARQEDEEAADAAAAIAEAAMDLGEGAAAAAAAGGLTGAAQVASEGARAAPGPALIPVHKAVSAEEAVKWRRTDNVILSVLQRYPIPELPKVWLRVQPLNRWIDSFLNKCNV